MKKIKKGDEIIVIAGKDKGKRGTVLSVLEKGLKLIVEGINLAKKHVKADPNRGERGGIVLKPMPLHHSNVMLYDASSQKGSRVKIRILDDARKVRCFKTTDEVIDI